MQNACYRHLLGLKPERWNPKPLKHYGKRLGLAKKGKAVTPRRIERDAVFHPEFREDLRYWVEVNRQVALRAFDLIEAILRDPFQGIGKPEPLKYLEANTWSRRRTQEHRIVYLVSADQIDFLQGRYHY